MRQKNLLKLLIKLDHCWDQDILIGQKVKKETKNSGDLYLL